jgi:hypothetical protein
LADACVDADPLVTHGAVDSLTLLTAAQLEHPSGTVASLLVSRASAGSSDQALPDARGGGWIGSAIATRIERSQHWTPEIGEDY